MDLNTYSVYFIIINLSSSKGCLDRRSRENVYEYSLSLELEDGLDIWTAPQLVTTVKVHVMLEHYKMNSKTSVMTIISWLSAEWTDERLEWDPLKYDNLTTTTIKSHNIWTPELNFVEDEYDNDFKGAINFPCDLNNNGNVNCRLQFMRDISCSTNMMNWPYDRQYCNLTLNIESKSVIPIYYVTEYTPLLPERNAEWSLLPFRVYQSDNCSIGNIKRGTLAFELQRKGRVSAAIIIFPCIILSIMTFIPLLLEVQDYQRFYILLFSLICHITYLVDITEYIPSRSSEPPTVLLYFRGSMALTSFLIVNTLLLNKLCKSDHKVHKAVVNLNDWVFVSMVKYFIWPKWKIISPNDRNRQWSKLANIINCVIIIITVIVYVTMYYTLIPIRKRWMHH